MNGYNRHSQYKRGVYRRRQIRTVWITAGVVLLLVAVLLLILGSILANQGRNEWKDESTTSDDIPEETKPSKSVPSVKASPVLLETSGSDTLASRLSALVEGGSVAASVPLNDESGALLYHSDLALELGFSTAANYSVTIARAAERAAEHGVYLSGTYHLLALTEEDELIRSVSLSKSAAVIADALRSGLHDVMLLLPTLTAEQLPFLLGLIEDIRALAPEGVLGCAVPPDALSEASASGWIDRLADGVDFLALDLTLTGDTDPLLYVENTLSASGTLFYLLRYEMRALLPQLADGALQNQLTSSVESHWTQNWQILSSAAMRSQPNP